MLDELKNLFKDSLQYTHTAGVLQQVANLVNIVNPQYTKDVEAKNTAIDVICKILQSHKEVPVPAQKEGQNASS
ncbi:MAG TPA: hypothetical protein VMR37_03120 [Rhabdochlamydiaceae bacterium]|nr:hypothetical protein [Rhabdochlamydiaceae bacterium]